MVGLPPRLSAGAVTRRRDMRFVLAGTLVVVSLAGCGGHHGQQTERIGPVKDTVITRRQTQDTMIVTTDTTVTVDTTMKKGREAVPIDSTKQATDSGRSQ
jgi:hypothetical protein